MPPCDSSVRYFLVKIEPPGQQTFSYSPKLNLSTALDLELATRRGEAFSAAGLARLRRYGVTHGIWDGPVDQAKAKAATLLECADPVLDRLVYKPPGAPGRARWRLVRYPEPFPAARAAIRVRFAAHERALLSGVSFDPDIQAVWYRAVDQPPASAGPIATIAKVISWDGRCSWNTMGRATW